MAKISVLGAGSWGTALSVLLNNNCLLYTSNDSKKLTAHKREELYDVIMREAVAVGLGMASPARIDEINILQATYEACLLYTSNRTSYRCIR